MLSKDHAWNKALYPLVIGTCLSFGLLVLTYVLGVAHYLSGLTLVFTILGLGTLQAVIQLIFFLHLGLESKPHWNLITFLFTALIIVVIVGGSIWIMYNINYNMMLMMPQGK